MKRPSIYLVLVISIVVTASIIAEIVIRGDRSRAVLSGCVSCHTTLLEKD